VDERAKFAHADIHGIVFKWVFARADKNSLGLDELVNKTSEGD
jgi:hypothetical protein